MGDRRARSLGTHGLYNAAPHFLCFLILGVGRLSLIYLFCLEHVLFVTGENLWLNFHRWTSVCVEVKFHSFQDFVETDMRLHGPWNWPECAEEGVPVPIIQTVAIC